MMRMEAVRAVADWLISDLNARIKVVPRDAADPEPPAIADYADPAHPDTLIAVFDETRHDWCADWQEPPALPALYVMSRGVVRVTGEPYPDGQIRATTAPLPVAISYLTSNADLASAIRDGEYTLRAVARSLRELSKNEHNDTKRTRNGVQVVLGEDPLEFYPVVRGVGNAKVTGGIVVNYYCRDTAPSYA